MIGLDAVGAARLADDLLAEGETLQSVWRYAIVQLLDDYSHDFVRSGASVASLRFRGEPLPTRSAEVDAALAALAEYLARRDNWPVPSWARKPERYSAKWWFVTPLRGMQRRSPTPHPGHQDLQRVQSHAGSRLRSPRRRARCVPGRTVIDGISGGLTVTGEHAPT